MPKRINPQDQWETDFQVPLPGEPRNIGPLETLFQRLLNRTERLKNRLGAILGLPWDATPPDTLAGLAGRVSTLETNQGGTTLSAHRTAATLDHPDGSVTSAKLANGAVTTPKIGDGAVTIPKLASVSTDPTPNTLALRNNQGAVQDGAKVNNLMVTHINGIYRWSPANKWFLLARWTGFSGNYRGLFADLTIVRVNNDGVGARLRASLRRDGSGNISAPYLSLATDQSTNVCTNAVLVQVDTDVIELWGFFPWGDIYVSGPVGTNSGSIVVTPYGNAESLIQDSPSTPVSGGLYLEWVTATVAQTLPGPGYIVAASRTPTSGYIRYDNGIQVCWATIIIGSGSWIYPTAFASTPQVQATTETVNAVPGVVNLTSVSTTSAGILRTDLSGNVRSGTVYLYAVGLWK